MAPSGATPTWPEMTRRSPPVLCTMPCAYLEAGLTISAGSMAFMTRIPPLSLILLIYLVTLSSRLVAPSTDRFDECQRGPIAPPFKHLEDIGLVRWGFVLAELPLSFDTLDGKLD